MWPSWPVAARLSFSFLLLARAQSTKHARCGRVGCAIWSVFASFPGFISGFSDVMFDDEALVVTSRISRSVSARSFAGTHRGMVYTHLYS
jgi:hypothetical protein